MRISIMISLLLVAISSNAEIHTWVDENGKKHFSDTLPDHMKHKSSTVNYDASIPSEAEREEAQRIYKQSKKHANGITITNTNKRKQESKSQKTEKKKHLTRNDKYKMRREEEAKAAALCEQYNISKKYYKFQAAPGNDKGIKRPENCI